MKYTTLISADNLEQNLNKPNWVIFDCRSSLVDHDAGLRAYNEGHIPSALFCDLETDMSSPITESTGRHPLPDYDELAKKLGDWGVDSNSQVIVYDDAGGALAVRLWWQLRTFGHNNVAILNGGIPYWIKSGKPINQDTPTPIAKTFTPKITEGNWRGTEQVFQNLTNQMHTLIDARTPERFRGESEPIDTVAGRIPGAINRPFQLNLNEEGLFLPEEELKKQFSELFKEANITSPDKVIHYCGSGVTALHNQLAMEIAGLSGSKLYPGSWSEWIRDDSREITVG